MSKIVEELQQAAELEKKAFYDYVKAFSSSAIAGLVTGGMEFEKAAELVKQACDLDPKANGFKTNALMFEKTAEHVAGLETQVSELSKVAEQFQETKANDESNPLNKLASAGFTAEEIEYMSTLPENLLEKVASGSQSNSAWEMGSGVGVAREKTDPLLEFILAPNYG